MPRLGSIENKLIILYSVHNNFHINGNLTALHIAIDLHKVDVMDLIIATQYIRYMSHAIPYKMCKKWIKKYIWLLIK